MNNKKSNSDDVVNESDDSSSQSDKEQTNGDALDYTTEIIFSAPFRTDIVLDSKKLLKDYKKFNSEVERNLNSTSQFAGWKLDPHIDYSEESNYGLISPDKPGLTNIAPYFIGYVVRAEDKCSGDTLKHLQTKINDELNSRINKIISNSETKENQHNFGNNFIVSKAKLKFYEFGFGSITVYVKCIKTGMIDKQALKYAIESDEIKSTLDSFISNYIDKYAENVPDKLLQKPQFEPHNNLVEAKKVYWTHRLISFILKPKTDKKSDTNVSSSEKNSPHKDKVNEFYHEKKKLLTQLVTVDDEDKITSNELKNRGQIFIPGVGNSILLSERNINLVSDVPEEQKELKLEKYLEEKIDNISNIISITGTHFAFVHYFTENLLYFVNKITKKAEKEKSSILSNGRIKKLINDIVKKLDIFSHINFLLQEYKLSYLSSIGKGAYHKLVKAWEFDKQWKGVKQQIDTLEKIYDRNDEFVNRRQQTVLSYSALTFACISVLTGFGKVNLFKVKFEFVTIDSFDNIFVILFLVILAYFVCKKIASLIKKYLPKLCYKISSFCRKISAKSGQ